MSGLRSSVPGPVPSSDGHVERVGRVLGRLDPWSFWVAHGGPGADAHFRVIGTTGGFVIAVCDAPGLLGGGSMRVIVGDRVIGGLSKVRRAAKRFHGELHRAVVDSPVEPVLCLTRASAGAPRIVRGVRVVTADRLISLIADRSKVVPRNRAQRGAETLGMMRAGGSLEEAEA